MCAEAKDCIYITSLIALAKKSVAFSRRRLKTKDKDLQMWWTSFQQGDETDCENIQIFGFLVYLCE